MSSNVVTSPKNKNRDWGRRAFTPARRRSVAAIAEAMFSDENEEGLVPAPRQLVDRIADEFDLLIGAGSADLRRGFGLLTFVIEWLLPLVMLGTFSRASRLSLARRVAYLQRIEHAKFALLATLFVAFKLPLTMLAFELDPELKLTGFDRPTIATPRLIARIPSTHATTSMTAPPGAEESSGG